MSKLLAASTVCMLLSIWAIIQLGVMGVLYKLGAVTLVEDTEEHHAEDLKEFITKTEANYATAAYSCFIVAGLYTVTLIISIIILKAGGKEKARKSAMDDDEVICLKVGDTEL